MLVSLPLLGRSILQLNIVSDFFRRCLFRDFYGSYEDS